AFHDQVFPLDCLGQPWRTRLFSRLQRTRVTASVAACSQHAVADDSRTADLMVDRRAVGCAGGIAPERMVRPPLCRRKWIPAGASRCASLSAGVADCFKNTKIPRGRDDRSGTERCCCGSANERPALAPVAAGGSAGDWRACPHHAACSVQRCGCDGFQLLPGCGRARIARLYVALPACAACGGEPVDLAFWPVNCIPAEHVAGGGGNSELAGNWPHAAGSRNGP